MIKLALTTPIILFSGIILGKILTESQHLSISAHYSALDKKPFNCRPCLTFHLLWIMYASAAYILNSWTLFWIGLALSFGTFAILYKNNQNKIMK